MNLAPEDLKTVGTAAGGLLVGLLTGFKSWKVWAAKQDVSMARAGGELAAELSQEAEIKRLAEANREIGQRFDELLKKYMDSEQAHFNRYQAFRLEISNLTSKVRALEDDLHQFRDSQSGGLL